VRDETAARLAIEVDGLRANLPGASAEHAALLEEALSDARALEPAFKELVARMRFLEKAACHTPVYSQPGMNAIIYAGAWNELPIAVPSTHVGVLAAYHGSGAYTVERGVRALIRRELKADHVALDIGAHVGLHAVVMGAIVKTEGALFCFEPDPDLAGALMQTFIMNGLTRHGAIVNAAVADRDGTHAFHRTLHSPESSLFGAGHSPTRDVVEVETIRLDGYFQPGARVDFAKIDAEGAEPSIIRGMARVLADNPGLRMVMEFAPEHIKRAGEEPGAFHDALVTHGFAIEMIDEGGGVAPISRDKLLSDVTHNIWLTPKRQA
jgi:FkbM family methyltransferase